MISRSDPIRCWCWYEGSRTTAPSVRPIRDILDGGGVDINGYGWARVQPIADGHPDPAIEHALMQAYTERLAAVNSAVAPSTEQPRPSALSRIWAILRGRG